MEPDFYAGGFKLDYRYRFLILLAVSMGIRAGLPGAAGHAFITLISPARLHCDWCNLLPIMNNFKDLWPCSSAARGMFSRFCGIHQS